MPTIADGRRWIKDRFSNDEYIKGSPKEALNALQENMQRLTPQERQRQLEHVKGYAAYYYNGHHKERVPREVVEKLNKTEQDVARANVMDQAREVIKKHGGAPTKETVLDAVDRSKRERETGIGRDVPKPNKKDIDKDRGKDNEQSIGY